MDVFQGKLRRGQAVLLTDVLGQSLGRLSGAGQGLTGEGGQQMVGNPSRQPVNRHDTAGKRAPVNSLKNWVYHRSPPALNLHGAVKDVLLARFDGPLQVALVEKGEVERAGIVNYLYLDQLQSLPDTGQPGMLRRHGGHAYPALRRSVPDGVDFSAVLVVPGIPGEKVPGGGQSQLLQLFGPGLPHTGELGEGCSACDLHGKGLLPVEIFPILPQLPRRVKAKNGTCHGERGPV